MNPVYYDLATYNARVHGGLVHVRAHTVHAGLTAAGKNFLNGRFFAGNITVDLFAVGVV